MVDAELLAESVIAWWLETLGVLLAAVGGVLAYRAGNLVSVLLALVLLVVVADRIRLRLDNRSLTAQIRRFQGRLRDEAGE
ncbi:MAG: hypothetical protein ABEJ28_07835 [Salinigranum sp.]